MDKYVSLVKKPCMMSILVQNKKNLDARVCWTNLFVLPEKKFTRKQVSSAYSKPINSIYHLKIYLYTGHTVYVLLCKAFHVLSIEPLVFELFK